jgi:hypothetical protein
MEEKIPWSGLLHVRDESGVTTDPTEIKQKARDFYKARMSPKDHAQRAQFQGQIPDAEIRQSYIPDANIDPGIWDSMFRNISEDEVEEILKRLPSGKAPGEDGLTYEVYKLIFLENKTCLAALTRLFNYSLQTGIFPSTASVGVITLLPKVYQWDGALKQTRPITLLETHRKLYEMVINSRLQPIIYGNDLLKGNNFGFREGVGTAEIITMIKHTIDISNLKDSPLFIALLDVEAAYDSIPHEAIYDGLTRLKAPARFINVLKGLEKHRTLKIDTPFGLLNHLQHC